MCKRAAFTLAEVLITLGIIGVVAAMTIPTLVANYKEKQTVSKLTKAYSTINNAYQMARIEYGDLSAWGFTTDSSVDTGEDGELDYGSTADNSKLFLDKLSSYLKIVKRIASEDASAEYEMFTLGGKQIVGVMPSDILFLADGTNIFGGWIASYKCMGAGGYCGDFYIDINGLDTPPNKFGHDIYSFDINKNGILPTGRKDAQSGRLFEVSCNKEDATDNYSGYGCTAWVIYNKNMDYLNCDDLSWDGKHSCDD